MIEISLNRDLKITETTAVLSRQDILGAWKVRWGINRMNYKVEPGLYRLGNPGSTSPVLVTANYKLTFDALRKELSGLDVWILVLDTKGVNVWCAAGKGTFGTREVIDRLSIVQLEKVVTHRTIILPQLAASGVSAHEVLKASGFKIIYGPVRAQDIPKYLRAGMKADAEMRSVKFGLYDRLVLTPVEVVSRLKFSLMIFGVLFLLNLLGLGPFGLSDFYGYLGALLIGCVLTPLLLPWIPGRAFAWKGWLLGLIWTLILISLSWPGMLSVHWLRAIAYLLILPSVSGYFAMNFTGSSTYTSFSGVLKEMRLAIPLQMISLGLGFIAILAGNLLS